MRIVISTPKPTIDPLAKRGNDKPVATNISTSTLYKTEDIVAPTINLTQSVPPIQPKTSPQQPTAPPQYNGNKQPNFDAPSISKTEPHTPNLPAKTPNMDNPSREMLIPATRMDGTPIQKESVLIPETVTTETVKEKSPFAPTERIEGRSSSLTNKAERTSRSSSVSKKSGFSINKKSSLFKKTSYKKTKHRKVKNKQKDKCYKF